MFRRGPWTFLLSAALALGAAASVSAGDGAAIDLAPLASYAAQEVAASSAGSAAHDAWVAIDAKLARPDGTRLASDLARLATVSKFAIGALSSDTELRRLLDEALAAADNELSAEPQAMTFHVSQIKLRAGRMKVLAVVDAATRLHEKGRAARDAGDEKRQIKAWIKADETFAQAVRLARSLIKKQGGGLGQF